MLCDMQDTYIIPWHLIYFLLDHLTSKIPDKLLIIKQCGYNFNMIQFLLQFINLTTWKVSTHVFWHSDNLLNNPTLSCSPLGRSSIMILDRPKPLFWAQSRFYCPAKPQLECQDAGLDPHLAKAWLKPQDLFITQHWPGCIIIMITLSPG